MFIDSHAHLEYPNYEADFSDVLARAKAAQVELILNIGTTLDHCKKGIELSQKYPHIFSSVGIHPHDANKVPADYIDQLKEFSKNPKVKAIGEIGLDYYYEHSPREIQLQRFEEQVRLAQELALPMSIHCRQAFQDCFDILNKVSYFKGVFHCFTGTPEEAKKGLDLGFYISFSGIVTFKKSTALQDVVKHVPLEKMLIETDAPFLAPEPHRGKRNEPAFVVLTAQKIADLKAASLETIAQHTTHNTKTLFQL